ncbi:hypothetical protein [Sphingomonas sp. Leaf339]|uniref:hypothetical protein n=1 Tax=Sphingomonas sp. Leaf339 TaxID=1736343 RepID=UPI000B1CE02C|nr:hypothetical protein [Sphingomonas sp. Leaf339]
MDDAFESGCGDDGTDGPCSICRGEELSPDFIAMLERAAAQPGRVMTAEETVEWLRSL